MQHKCLRDVRVSQAMDERELLAQVLHLLRVRLEKRMECLQRHLNARDGIARKVDDADPPPPSLRTRSYWSIRPREDAAGTAPGSPGAIVGAEPRDGSSYGSAERLAPPPSIVGAEFREGVSSLSFMEYFPL